VGRARPVAALLVLVAVLLAGSGARVDPEFDVTFGCEAWRRPGTVACVLAALALVALHVSDAAADRAGRTVAGIVAPIPVALRLPLLLVAALAAFLGLPDVSLSGDAMDVVARTAVGDVQPSNALTSWLEIGVARAAQLDALAAVRVVTCVAGAAGVAASVWLARELFEDAPRRVATAVLLTTTGGAALWFGSVEVYAPLGAAVVAYLAVGVRSLRGAAPVAAAAAVLGVAFALHGAAGLLLPSLAFLVWQCGAAGLARRFAAAAAAFALPVVAVIASLWIFTWSGTPPEVGPRLWGNFLGAGGDGPFVPLTPDPGLRARYSLLDAEHVLAVLSTLLLAAPAAWTLLGAGGGGGGTPDRRATGFALAALVPWIVFPCVWNVSYGLRRDWDLFSAAGFPAVLAASVLTLREPGAVRAAVRVVAISLFTFVPLVLTHAGTREERRDFALVAAWVLRAAPDPRGPEFRERAAATWDVAVLRHDPAGGVARVDRALRAAASGDDAAALADLDAALVAEPSQVFALQARGLAYRRAGRRDDARRDLEASLRTPRENLRFPARVGLARIALDAGDRPAARRHLERAIREDSENRQAGEARALLDRAR
jgi:hypothetical protein